MNTHYECLVGQSTVSIPLMDLMNVKLMKIIGKSSIVLLLLANKKIYKEIGFRQLFLAKFSVSILYSRLGKPSKKKHNIL